MDSQSLKEYIDRFNWRDTPEDIKSAITMYVYENYNGEDAPYLSAKFLNTEACFKGEQHVFPKGYFSLLYKLAENMDIHLNQ